jgi:hypothetical protein
MGKGKNSKSVSGSSSNLSNITKTFITIVVIALLYYVYLYLTKLESCVCVHGGASGENKADLQKLRYIELLFITLNVIGLLFLWCCSYDIGQLVSKGFGAVIYLIVLLVIYVYLVTNVLKLYKNMPNNCECAIQWPRYFLYIQGFIASILLFIVAFTIIVGLIGLIMISMKK